MQRLVFLITIILFFLLPKGNSSTLDSLLLAFKNAKEDSTKVALLFQLGSENYNNGEYRSAVEYYKQAGKLSKKRKPDRRYRRSLAALGQSYYELGQLDSAQLVLEENLRLNEIAEDKDGLLNAYNNLALVYHYRLQFDKTLEMYQNAMKIAEEQGDLSGVALLNSNMGIIFGQQGNVKKALEYFHASLGKAKKANDKRLQQTALTNIGRAHIEREEFAEASVFLQDALLLAESEGDIPAKAATLDFLGLAALNQGQFELAGTYYNQVLDIYRANEAQARVAKVIGRMAEMYCKQGEHDKALQYGNEALNIAREIQLNEVIQQVYLVLSQSCSETRNYTKANEYLNKYIELRDSLFSEKSSQRIAEMQTKYETEKKDAENELLRLKAAQNETKIHQKNRLNIATGIIVILASLLAFFYYRNYQQKLASNRLLEEEVQNRTAELRSTNDKLFQSNAELKSFAYIASHDLKEPLRNISSYTSLIEHQIGKEIDEETQEYMGLLKQNTRQMYELIEDVLAYTTITEEESIAIEEVDLNKVVSQTEEALEKMVKERNASISYDALPTVNGKFAQFFLILKNLVENGIKYNENNAPSVKIQYAKNGNTQRISVIDNGIGIAPAYHEKIFGMFKRLHNRNHYSGTGIGLAICHKIANRMGGNISLESEEGKGSAFHFDFPV